MADVRVVSGGYDVGGECEAACAAERDVALLKVRGLSAKVEVLREEVAGHDVALLEGGEREAAYAAERDEALLEDRKSVV